MEGEGKGERQGEREKVRWKEEGRGGRHSLKLVESQTNKEHYEQMMSVPKHLKVGAPEEK